MKLIKNVFIACLTAVATLIVGFLIGYFIVLPIWVGKGRITQVPDVRGREISEAMLLLRKFHLRGYVERKEYNEIFPPGVVINQSPLPRKRVKWGREVALIISKGKKHVVLPNFAHLWLMEVEDSLRRLGLRWRVRFEPSDTVEAGRVICTEPAPMSVVELDDEITVIVSSGTKVLTMPDLHGLSLRRAREKLFALGLILRNVVLEDSLHPGYVVDQYPPPGVEVFRGDSVDLILSPK